MAPSQENPIRDVSYLSLRRTIGYIGFFMPWLVRVVANLGEGPGKDLGYLKSISAYYYTSAHDVFVGLLFAAGLFLCFYRGSVKSIQDRILGVIWGFAAAFIGLVPMDRCEAVALPSGCVIHSTQHFIPVTVFFAISIYMTLFRFTKSPKPENLKPEKKKRNKVYIVCGVVMLASALILFYNNRQGISIFWPEAIALFSFSVAWLVKGHTIFADKPRSPEAPVAAAAALQL